MGFNRIVNITIGILSFCLVLLITLNIFLLIKFPEVVEIVKIPAQIIGG